MSVVSILFDSILNCTFRHISYSSSIVLYYQWSIIKTILSNHIFIKSLIFPSAFFTIFLITPPVLLLLKLLPCQKFHHSFHFLCYPPVKYWKLPSWKHSSLALKLLWSYVLLKPNCKLGRDKDKWVNYHKTNISYNLPVPLH